MLRVIIKSIDHQYLLNDNEYAWINSHLNTPLKVLTLSFDAQGNAFILSVYTEDDACGGVITMFVDGPRGLCNYVKYELVGSLPMNN